MTENGTGLLGTIVFAGLALGALGMGMRFAENMANPRPRRRRDSYDYLDYKPRKRSKNNDIFDWGF
jgi:hypothetical protein